jgi:hypothetical protein
MSRCEEISWWLWVGVSGGVVAPEIKRKTRTLTQTEFLRLCPPRVVVSLGKLWHSIKTNNRSIYRDPCSQSSTLQTFSLVKCTLCLHLYTIRFVTMRNDALDYRRESHVVEMATFSPTSVMMVFSAKLADGGGARPPHFTLSTHST